MPLGWEVYPRSTLPESHWAALYAANTALIDEAFSDLVEVGRGTPFAQLGIGAYLPSKYLFRYDDVFLRKFLVCLASVGSKLRLPGFHPIGCTAEEIAVLAMKTRAEELLAAQGEEADFAIWDDIALEDADCELLFDPAFDGIEEAALARDMAFANLRYDEWFVPFNAPRLVHPYIEAGVGQPHLTDREHFPPGDAEDPR